MKIDNWKLKISAAISVAALSFSLTPPATAVSLQVPFGGRTEVADLADYVATFYQYFVSVIGIIAVVIIMWGGLRWLTAGGSAEKVTKAKEMMFSAVIGVVIILLSYVFLATVNPELVRLRVPSVVSVGRSSVTAEIVCTETGVDCGITRAAEVTPGQNGYCIGSTCSGGSVCQLTGTQGQFEAGSCQSASALGTLLTDSDWAGYYLSYTEEACGTFEVIEEGPGIHPNQFKLGKRCPVAGQTCTVIGDRLSVAEGASTVQNMYCRPAQ